MAHILLRAVAILMFSAVAASVSAHSPREGVDPMSPPMKDHLKMAASLKFKFDFNSSFILGIINRCAVWDAARPLKVCFIDGDAQQRDQFVTESRTWIRHRQQLLDFGVAPNYRVCAGDKSEEIRIAFRKIINGKKADHWGCVGRNSRRPDLECGKSDASLNINPDLVAGDAVKFRIAVLHEMGHALGFEHEHQHPDARCFEQLNMLVVYPNFRQMGFSEPEIDAMFRALVGDKYDFRKYDRTSIMHYHLHKNFFHRKEQASCYVPQNVKLSGDDEKLAREYYPPVGSTPPDCADMTNNLLMSLNLTRAQKLALGEEVLRTLAAGATDKKTVTFRLPPDAGPSTVPDWRPFATHPEGQAPLPPTSTDGLTRGRSGCAPTTLDRKATCSLSSDGTTLRITID